ncbi:hypothetical protein SEA_DIANE_73 [Streptomyces phage Diane]|uniref:Uncharacterized protein n=1 Tax=Streptomyces phage Diane TaxID=2041207 RepID=A0A291LHM4_9CAUD|nr:hypothetical protein KGG78_gp73 [Streptomyces phage Diane]ATI18857.1 hypothetical protein SEA_DIANE_73 [Streptomyces phage Diane]
MNLFRKFFRPAIVEPVVVKEVPEPLTFALDNLAETFRFYCTAEAGAHFTCGEADAIARVLVASGHRDEAITWLHGHAVDDEWGDLHYDGDEDDPEDEGRVLTEDELGDYVDLLV